MCLYVRFFGAAIVCWSITTADSVLLFSVLLCPVKSSPFFNSSHQPSLIKAYYVCLQNDIVTEETKIKAMQRLIPAVSQKSRKVMGFNRVLKWGVDRKTELGRRHILAKSWVKQILSTMWEIKHENHVHHTILTEDVGRWRTTTIKRKVWD